MHFEIEKRHKIKVCIICGLESKVDVKLKEKIFLGGNDGWVCTPFLENSLS